MDWTQYTIGRRLRLACEMLGLDKNEAAQRIGMSMDSFYYIAADRGGKYGPTVGSLTTIANGLGIRMCWLVAGEGEIFHQAPPQTQKTGTPEGVPVMPLKAAKLPSKRQPRRG